MKKVLLIITIFLFLAPFANATTIDTTTAGDPSSWVQEFGGLAKTHYYGQTFNIGSDSDTLLNSISFEMMQLTTENITFDFNIYNWDGSSVSGSPLYSDTSLSTTAENEWETFLISGIDITLQNNTDYIFVIDASADSNDGFARVASGTNGVDLYGNGQFVYKQNDGEQRPGVPNWWRTNQLGVGDLAFIMETSSPAPVPEPATMLLFGFGLLGLAGVNRRKQ